MIGGCGFIAVDRQEVPPQLTSSSGSIDKQTSSDDDFLSSLQVSPGLDKIAIRQTGLDLAKLDRFIVVHYPQPYTIAFIDQRLFWHPDRGMVSAGVDCHVG
jgi:hypothetical protein